MNLPAADGIVHHVVRPACFRWWGPCRPDEKESIVNTARCVSRLVQSKPVAPTRFFRIVAAGCTLLGDEDGVTVIEYALLAALITLVIAGTVSVIGTQLNSVFSAVAAAV